MNKRRYIMLFGDAHDAVSELEDAAAGRLFKALLAYALDGSETKLFGEERYLYKMFLAQFARDEEAYRKRCERNRKNYEDRRAPVDENETVSSETSETVQNDSDNFSAQYKDKEQDQEKEKDKDDEKDKDGVVARAPAKKTGQRFTPPTLQQVAEYAASQGLSFDAQRFLDYNASRGWMSGARPIADWQAAARLWASRGDFPSSGVSPPKPKPPRVLEQQSYSQRSYTPTLDAVDQLMQAHFPELAM